MSRPVARHSLPGKADITRPGQPPIPPVGAGARRSLARARPATALILQCDSLSCIQPHLSTYLSPTVVDNYHNSFPTAIERVEKIARDELPADATQAQKDACKVEVIKGDLRDRDIFSNVFKSHTGDDAIYATILVAALKAVGESGEIPIEWVPILRCKVTRTLSNLPRALTRIGTPSCPSRPLSLPLATMTSTSAVSSTCSAP